MTAPDVATTTAASNNNETTTINIPTAITCSFLHVYTFGFNSLSKKLAIIGKFCFYKTMSVSLLNRDKVVFPIESWQC